MSGARSHPSLAVLVVCVAGVAASLGWAGLTSSQNHDELELRFRQRALEATDRLHRQLSTYEFGLRGLRGVVVASGERLNREIFARYVASRDLAREFPGSRGFGFIQPVPPNGETAFIDAVRADGMPQFELRSLGPNPGDKWIIRYVEPLQLNKLAVGLDIASEPRRFEAAMRAIRFNRAELTAPITLLQAQGDGETSFLLMLPIWSNDRTEAVGLAYMPIIGREALGAAAIQSSHYRASLRDRGVQVPFLSVEPHHGGDLVPALKTIVPLEIFGRSWDFEFEATRAFVEEAHLRPPWTSFAVGLLVTLLLASVTAIRQRLVAKQDDEHRQHLLRSALVDHTGDAVIMLDRSGHIRRWQGAAEDRLGWRASEVVGQRIQTLLAFDLRADRLVTGASTQFDVVTATKTGEPFEARASVVAFSDDDLLLSLRDLGAKRRIEREVRLRTAQLERAERTLSDVIAALPTAITYWNAELVNDFANQVCAEWFGQTPERLKGHGLREVAPQFYEKNRPALEAALRGETQVLDFDLAASATRLGTVNCVPDRRDGVVRGLYLFVHDVTDLKKSHERLRAALRENEGLVSTLRTHSQLSITDAAGTIIDVNDAFCTSTGYGRTELIGQNHRLLSSGRHAREFWKDLWDTLAQGKAWRGEICDRAKNGDLFWVDTIIAPFFDDGGKVERYVSIRQDITDRKRLLDELGEQHRRLSEVLRATGTGMWVLNIDSGDFSFSDSMAALLGLPPGGLNHQIFTALGVSEDIATFQRELERHVAGETPGIDVEARFRRGDGTLRRLRARGSRVERAGHPTMVYGVFEDVTQLHDDRRRLARSESFLTRVGRLAGVGGWQLDLGSDEVTWSAEARTIWRAPPGYTPNRHTLSLLLSRESRAEAAELTKKTIETGLGWQRDLECRTFDGEPIWVRLTCDAELEGGKAVRLVGSMQDVSDERKAAKALEDASEAAERANRAKSEFLANMSHDIRTPLSAVISFSGLLESTSLDENQRETVNSLKLASQSLLGLINDVLDLSKIEANELQLEKRTFDLSQVLREVRDVYGMQARQRGLDFSLEVERNVHTWVLGDEVRLRQVLSNLIGNAIKFTQRGVVTVMISSAPANDGEQRLTFAIKDTGPGIPADVLTTLFRPFTQADSSTTRRFGGTGLGLAIVKRLTELMGGDVEAKSTVGIGSEFRATVCLPKTEAKRSVLTLVMASTEPNANLCSLATDFGWKVLPATTEAQARHLIVDADALLFDDTLFSSSGVRESGTPSVYFGDEATWAANARVSPTTSASGFFNAVSQALATSEGGSVKLSESTGQNRALVWLSGVRVLVVDDSLVNLEAASRILKRDGALVTARQNGREAVDLLRVSGEQFDVVLMDMHMPELDGYDAARIIRNELKLVDLPIIALTAGAMMAERERALEVGVNDYLTKPFNPVVLAKLVRRFVEQRRGSLLPILVRSDLTPSDGWPAIEGVDLRGIEERLGRADDFYSLVEEVLREFLPLARSPVEELAGMPRDRLEATLHKLKGSAGVVGATDLARAASLAERDVLFDGDSNASLRAVQQALATLRKSVTASQSRLKAS